MKKIVALLLSILLMLGVVACSKPSDKDDKLEVHSTTESDITAEITSSVVESEKKTIDLLEYAIELSKMKKGLSNMASSIYGTGSFKDFNMLLSNPLKSASYPMEISALTKQIDENAKGFDGFFREVTGAYGFSKDFTVGEYKPSTDIHIALNELYSRIGETSGAGSVADAVKSRLTPEATEALAEYLWTMSYALYYNLQVTKDIGDADYQKISEYYYCDVATSDPSALERVSKKYNFSSETMLMRSGMLMIEASCRLIEDLKGMEKITSDGERFSVDTPIGSIIVGSNGKDIYNSPEAILIIDPDGDDTYNGKIAASLSKSSPISTVIDLDGNDRYVSGNGDGASQGGGLFGVGLLFDLRGDDRYMSYRLSQGAAIHGTGVLFDGGGNDIYSSKLTSQAAGYYGFAALVDVGGNDKYNALAVAQASAGTRAMSFLIDKSGNDSYYVEPYEVIGFEYLDYGQFKDVNGNWSQGCGMGQRNIGISGGLGGLIDIEGDDIYTGGIWVQGVGYWSGIGFLTDMAGDDIHNSQYYSQASVAHYGAAMLMNIGGDDVHSLVEGKTDGGEGASIGFVWDRGVAMFVNDGGNDKYTFDMTCCGVSWSAYDDRGPLVQDKTYAFFIETEGNDTYSCRFVSDDPAFGYGRGGFFIDADGNDRYKAKGAVRQNTSSRSAKNGGVIIDYGRTDDEIATIKLWDEAKSKFFD